MAKDWGKIAAARLEDKTADSVLSTEEQDDLAGALRAQILRTAEGKLSQEDLFPAEGKDSAPLKVEVHRGWLANSFIVSFSYEADDHAATPEKRKVFDGIVDQISEMVKKTADEIGTFRLGTEGRRSVSPTKNQPGIFYNASAKQDVIKGVKAMITAPDIAQELSDALGNGRGAA
jgi:hypothetical protein